MKLSWLFWPCFLYIWFVVACSCCVCVPVWEDFTVWPSGAWLRAINPVFGVCLKFSPPKLNFSSAFCQTIRRAVKHVVHQAQLLSTSISNCSLILPLAHRRRRKPDSSDFEEYQKPNRDHFLKKEWEKHKRPLCYLRSTTDVLHKVYFKILKSRTAETSPFLEKEIWLLSKSR